MFECKFSYIFFVQLWGWQLVSLGYYVTKATLSLLHGFSSLSTPFDAKKTWLIASMRHFRSFQFHILFLFFCHFCFQLFSKVKSRVRQRLPYLLDNSNYEHKNEFVFVLKRGLWSNRYRNLLPLFCILLTLSGMTCASKKNAHI